MPRKDKYIKIMKFAHLGRKADAFTENLLS